MLFNSYEFIFIFLPVTFTVFYSLANFNKNFASLWLAASSILFYGLLSAKYLPVLLISIIINYLVSLKIYNSSSKKFWLVSGIAFNFILLGYFKVINVLPLGISFYTFTQTAYIVEVFRRSITAKSSFLEYSSFISFFPCIASGPIADVKTFSLNYELDYDNLAKGMTRFMFGLFKKVCIADILAPEVNKLFTNTEILTFFDGWAAALGYSMQLYFDFSSYSDMAIGLGLMFGVKLPENFNSPYKSLSIIDFWRRWHMSLCVWIRDYIYIPLGGSRKGELIKIRNVITAMLFTGIWHGLGWTFILWGAFHGVLLTVNHQWRRLNVKIPVLISWLITFLSVVLCWVIFRAGSLHEALKVYYAMFNLTNIVVPKKLIEHIPFLQNYGIKFGTLSMNIYNTLRLAPLMIIALFCPNTGQLASKFSPSFTWLVIILVIAIISFWNFSEISDFLYFQF